VAVGWATAGTVPQIPEAARRELTEAAIAVLATTLTKARITVISDQAGVAVSVFCDSPAEPRPMVADGQIMITTQRADGGLWMEARWQAR
jgi:hypothetical protein